MKMMKIVMLGMLVMLTCAFNACSTTGTPTDTQKVETACASATSAIQALTVANEQGKLTPEQQKIVLEAIGVTTPVCTADTPPSMDDLKMQAFNRAVEVLRTRMAQL